MEKVGARLKESRRPFDRRLRVNVATFLSRYEDLQLGVFELDATGTPFSATVNQGRAPVRIIRSQQV
jgi:hypothetical protein